MGSVGLLFEGVQPYIFTKMVDKNNVVFVTINGVEEEVHKSV